MRKFTITAHLVDGTSWETVRYTKSGLDAVMQEINSDDNVVKFVVEEAPYTV